MEKIALMLQKQYQHLFDGNQQQYTFSQSTPYIEINVAKYLLETQHIVVSIYPTLYAAMHAYEFTDMGGRSVFFGADEFISAQILSASPELLLQRIDTLKRITNLQPDEKLWIITHVAAVTRPIVSKENFMKHTWHLKLGDHLEREDFLTHVFATGYERVPVVSKPGEVAVRGDVIDIFPPNYELPLRLSFFDTELEVIFQFDIQTQLTSERLKTAMIVPMSDQFIAENKSILSYFSNYQLLFHQIERIQTTYEHMGEDALQFNEKNKDLAQETTKLFIPLEELGIAQVPTVTFGALTGDTSLQATELIETKRYDVGALQKEVQTYYQQGYTLYCLIGQQTETTAIQEMTQLLGDSERIVFVRDISFNEVSHALKQVIVDYASLFGIKDVAKRNEIFANVNMENRISQLNEIENGDFVVHIKHGIGRYDGIQTITAQGVERDYIVLTYRDEEKVYLPTEKIDALYKYTGSKEGYVPKLSKIGDRSWKRKTQKVQEHIDAFAQDLFLLYMEREKIPGFAFPADTPTQRAFEAKFPYQETKDQTAAIAEIKRDMQQPYVMERILCGDVGFGKTEVAFRAAFKAMEAGKQVVMLAPTTILARQHYENALKRFAGFGFNIAMLSRLVSPQQQKEVLFNTELGEVNLLIGTHRLLSDDVVYDNLGLVIIDEEHRFGVKAKEKLKQFKKNIDVLLISATPIPRTLQMAVTGIREMSLLQTAPHNRYPVQTYVLEQNEHIVMDAIERELARKGQTYYLYNKVQSITNMTAKLQEMFPYAVVGYAHGQMPKKQLEDIITKFIDKEIDILVSTTIIENGMDIPNANTLIVHDADTLGLAQLYQIRGRVGRSEKIAYGYFMYNKGRVLTEEALKRLQTIQSFTEFGSGYQIAMRDLAIRGAGDILGKQQSGFINDVGFDLYVDMLQNAVLLQRGVPEGEEITIPRFIKAELDTNDIDVSFLVPTYIPSTYVSDESIKIEIYQLLEKITSLKKLDEIQEILIDRFGTLPVEVESLCYLFLYRSIGRRLGVKQIKQVKNKVTIQYEKTVTQTFNRVRLFRKLHTREIEVKYTLGSLHLGISTLRKETLEWLQEILVILELVENDRKER